MRSLEVVPSEEWKREWREEVKVLNFEWRRVYAAVGNEGISSQTQSGFWITYFQIGIMKLGFIPADSNSDLISGASNTDFIFIGLPSNSHLAAAAAVSKFRRFKSFVSPMILKALKLLKNPSPKIKAAKTGSVLVGMINPVWLKPVFLTELAFGCWAEYIKVCWMIQTNIMLDDKQNNLLQMGIHINIEMFIGEVAGPVRSMWTVVGGVVRKHIPLGLCYQVV